MLKKLPVIHPFLFALFPILFLFAYNIDEVSPADLLLPILVVIAGTLVLFFSLRLITKSYSKSGIITSFFLVLFFSYGRIRDLIVSLGIGGFYSVSFYLGCLWVLLFIAGAFFIIKSRSSYFSFTKFLNITAIALVVISLVNISIYQIKTINLAKEEINKEDKSLSLNSSDNLPDIYYIILDEYARASTLKEFYNYDNSEFIGYLTSKGFYVAAKSRSNYGSTLLSLSSSLNMDYLTAEERESTTTLLEMMGNSEASRFLKSKGYHSIFVPSSYDFKDIDKYLDVYSPGEAGFGTRISNFTSYLIQTTGLAPFAALFSDHGRSAILNAFDVLADMPDLKEPTFVFAHILSPHQPFIFDRNGNPVKINLFELEDHVAKHYQEGYLEQLLFINEKVKNLINEILSKSDVEPIIILQADTGPKSVGQAESAGLTNKMQMDERMNIFNAYYFPEKDYDFLYESITPVNTFRLVFNLYFDANYDLLKDESYQ